MIKRLALTLTCTALLTALSTSANANPISFNQIPVDTISFSFLAASGAALSATAGGLTAGPFGLASNTVLQVIDSAGNNVPVQLSITGAEVVLVSTGAASSYVSAGGNLKATYAPGTGVEVELIAPACGGICVEGSENGDNYDATNNHTGSFNGQFIPTYIDPAILAYFGDTGDTLISGSDTLTTGKAHVTAGDTTASVLTGDIGVDLGAPTPEPSSLMLLGTGLLGFAGLLRQRRKAL